MQIQNAKILMMLETYTGATTVRAAGKMNTTAENTGSRGDRLAQLAKLELMGIKRAPHATTQWKAAKPTFHRNKKLDGATQLGT
ncbi:hypothetical protein ACHAW6_005560 [Cyclotella cf. meneghiniana]